MTESPARDCLQPLPRSRRAADRGLTPYVPGKPVSELERELGIRDSVKLASNENPLGCGEKARAAYLDCAASSAAIRTAAPSRCARPSPATTASIRRRSRWATAPTTCSTSSPAPSCTRGAESVFSEHAFAVYPIATQAVGATARVAPARDFGHDLDAMAALVNERTRVVWIANPNNPTGTWLGAKPLRAFIDPCRSSTLASSTRPTSSTSTSPTTRIPAPGSRSFRTSSSPVPSPRCTAWRRCASATG
jgi:hypothetical protein